jgi:putative NADPH-quinone reductase
MKKLLISAFPNKEKSLTEQIVAKAFEDVDYLHLSNINAPFYDGGRALPPIVATIFDKMSRYDEYIFAFPVYWSNMPAVLKNLMDWSIFWGIKYDLDSPCEPALKNKRAIVIATSGDKYDKEEQEKILNLVSKNVLELWGVEIERQIFVDSTYNFSNERFDLIVERLKG